MSDGNRHHVIAFSGVAAAFGFMLAAAVLPINEPAAHTEQYSSAEPTKSAEQWAAEVCAIAAQADAPDTAQQQPRDLCAQFRAAAAAERSAVFEQQQVRIGWLTFAGLLATVIIALAAWRASASSAKADNEALKETKEESGRQLTRHNDAIARADNDALVQAGRFAVQIAKMEAANKTARDIGQAQTRAYLSVTGAKVEIGPSYDTSSNWRAAFHVTLTVKNSGQSPARKMKLSAEGRWTLRRVGGGPETHARAFNDVSSLEEAETYAVIRTPHPDEGPDVAEMGEFWFNVVIEGIDVFGEPVEAKTNFLVFWDPDEDRRQTKPMIVLSG